MSPDGTARTPDDELDRLMRGALPGEFSFFGRQKEQQPPPLTGIEPGRVIDDFKLIAPIGQGGMGQVWEAEQLSLNRRVALKLVRPDRVNEHTLDLFSREARAGGRLHHSGIVTVYGHGEADGVAWISMELVEGAWTLKNFIEETSLKGELPDGYYPRVAELVAALADAVQAAHEANVIHRDLKPGNVLITPDEHPKVTDFGLAKITDETALSVTGDFAGTYAYMSPEQVAAKRIGLDHRTDIFSLGVVFYELLALQRPFIGDTSQQVGRQIMLEDPTDPRKLRSKLPRDLAVISGKCLEKHPDRRYQSMAGLAADIRRHLGNEPIHAKPPTVSQRATKWIRRHPTPSVAGTVAVIALVAIAALWLLAEANLDRAVEAEVATAQERDRAVRAEAEAKAEALRATAAEEDASQRADERDQIATFQAERLKQIDPEMMGVRLRRSLLTAGGDDRLASLTKDLAGLNFTSISLELLEQNLFGETLEAIDHQFEDQPLVQAQLLGTMGGVLTKLGLLDLATDPTQRALGIRREKLGDDHPDTLGAISGVGVLLLDGGKLDEAEPLFREALEGSRRVLGDDHPYTLGAINNMGTLLNSQGKLDEAEHFFREALEGKRRVLGDDHPDTLTAIGNMGVLLWRQGKLDEAEPFHREALEGKRRVLGDDHPDTLTAIGNMAVLLMRQGKLDEAEPFHREALEGMRRVLGDDHPNTLGAINNMGTLLNSQGKLDEAEPFVREALEGNRRVLGDDHPDTLGAINNMGTLLNSQGKLEKAEPFVREALEGSRRVLGDDHPRTLLAISNMAVLLVAQGKLAEAERFAREALEGSRRVLWDDHPARLTAIRNLSFVLMKLIPGERGGDTSDLLGSHLADLGELLLLQGQFEPAEEKLSEGFDLLAEQVGDTHWRSSAALSSLGAAMAGQGRVEEAESLLLESAETLMADGSLAKGQRYLGVEVVPTAIQRVVDFYAAWHAAAPTEGHDKRAAEWRARLSKWKQEQGQ